MADNSNLDQVTEGEVYRVVINDEEQYSILRSHVPNPDGWRDEGFRGAKDECLSHIDEVWTDMRPLSLRRQMGG